MMQPNFQLLCVLGDAPFKVTTEARRSSLREYCDMILQQGFLF
ncbi:hypothetical protein E2320_012651 [Naja naja]|nr:hypothetical protein E2320_012651 [Naja naja]